MLTFTLPDNTREDHANDQCNRQDYKKNIRFFQVHWSSEFRIQKSVVRIGHKIASSLLRNASRP